MLIKLVRKSLKVLFKQTSLVQFSSFDFLLIKLLINKAALKEENS